jgi:diadenylate cyclase
MRNKMTEENVINNDLLNIPEKNDGEVNNLENTENNLEKDNPDNNLNVIKPVKEKKLTKLDILRKLSPGTELREGLNDIISGELGAIIVVANPKTLNIFEGGFKVNCKFTSKRLAELAKMDGAIILSEDFKKILYCNALLVPDRNIPSIETGTRHQAGERTAKQTGNLVITVSERRKKITVYYGNSRYMLKNSEELLRRSTETLQILEKQREVFDELLINMNILEVTNLVSVRDVCNILQRMEMIKKMANVINEYIVELGKEGIIVRMRMKEVTKGIDKEQELIVRDYGLKFSKVLQFFDNLSFEGLLDSENIARLLFGESPEIRLFSKGYRILGKTSLNSGEVKLLINNFKNLEGILNADGFRLAQLLKNRSESFQREVSRVKEQIMMGKKI